MRLMGIHKRIVADPVKVSSRFSGKNPDGKPLHGHQHAFILPLGNGRGRIDRILLLAAGGFDASEIRAILGLRELYRAGSDKPIRVVATWRGQSTDPKMRPRAETVVNATPFVSSRYWRKGRGTPQDFWKGEVRRECRNHGLPEPLTVDFLERPHGLFEWAEFRRNRKEDPVRPGYGFRVKFPEPVATPFSLGYSCHFGLGQFQPET
jgi:CRISPR-associated protein Csb2